MINLLFACVTFWAAIEQNTIHNYTADDNLTQKVRILLHELAITGVTINLLVLTPKIYKQLRASGHDVEALTTSDVPKVHSIFIGFPKTKTKIELIAHELIHVKQGYDQIDCVSMREKCEYEAELAERRLANKIW